jgi:hypothetical protein
LNEYFKLPAYFRSFRYNNTGEKREFHSDDYEMLEFEKKPRSNDGLFRVVLNIKSCFSMQKYGYNNLIYLLID